MIIKFFKRLDIRLIGIFIVIACLWNTGVVDPLKIFVVFMHEVSHGLAALATGVVSKKFRLFSKKVDMQSRQEARVSGRSPQAILGA